MEQGDNEAQKKQQISRRIKQNNILKNGALSVAESGWGKEAFCVAGEISDIAERNEVFADIASIQVELGNFVQAFNIIKNIYGDCREKVKVKVVRRLVRLGKIEQAEKVLGLIKANNFNDDSVYHCEVPLRDINNKGEFTFEEMICAWKKLDQETKDKVGGSNVTIADFGNRPKVIEDIKNGSAANNNDPGSENIATDKKPHEELKLSSNPFLLHPNVVVLKLGINLPAQKDFFKNNTTEIEFPQKISEEFNDSVSNEGGLSDKKIELLRRAVEVLGIKSLKNGGSIDPPKITSDNAKALVGYILFVQEDKYFKNMFSKRIEGVLWQMLNDAMNKSEDESLLLQKKINFFNKLVGEMKNCEKVNGVNAEYFKNIALVVLSEIKEKKIETFVSRKDMETIKNILKEANMILLEEALVALGISYFNRKFGIKIPKITSKNCERIKYAVLRLTDESFLKEMGVCFPKSIVKEMERVLKILNKN